MSSDEQGVCVPPLVDLHGVLEARRKQAEEDREELERLDPLDLLKELQTRLDIIRLRSGRASSDLLREFLFEAPQWRQPSERERSKAVVRLARRWVDPWKLHEDRVQRAVRVLAAEQGLKPSEKKEKALRVGILEALAEAHEPQVTRIGRDRARSLGSRIRLYQKQDFEKFAREGLTDELKERLDRPPAGIRVFPPYRLLSPIEAAFLGGDLEMVRPIDLRPRLLAWWVRKRAMKRAEDRLLDEAGLDPSSPEWARQIGIDDPESDNVGVVSAHAGELSELEVLEALNHAHHDPLRQIIARENVAKVLEAATPDQREIIELLDGFHVQNGLPRADAIKMIAEERGVTVNAIHKARSRLVKKIRD